MKFSIIILLFCFALTYSEKPNIIIFLTDDQGTLDTRTYGSDDLITPNMDKLAQTGVQFSRCYAHAVCCPTRSLLLTGRDNIRTGVTTWTQRNPTASGDNIHQDELTIASLLKNHGYKTGAFGKWHLGARPGNHPTDMGFDEFFGLLGGFIGNYTHHFLHGAGGHDLYRNSEEVFQDGEYFPDLVTAEALDFLDQNSGSPFFLYVAYNIPHYPEQSEAPYDTMYKNLEMPRQSYARMVSATDGKMGEIMDRVEELGLTDNTMMIFMSDNGHSVENYAINNDNHSSGLPRGFNYGANGGGGYTGKWKGNKGQLFEGGIRVPMIISYPASLPAGQVRDHMVGAEDILPTVLEATGIPRPTDRIIDGRSLWPVLLSNDTPPVHDIIHRQWQANWAVIEDDWKLYNGDLWSLTGDSPERQRMNNGNTGVVNRLQGIRNEWDASITTADVGDPIEGIGCMDTNYTEYDSEATIRDQALCLTPIAVSVEKRYLKEIKIHGTRITFTGSRPHNISVSDLQGRQVLGFEGKGNKSYSLDALKVPGVYIAKITENNQTYVVKIIK